MNETDSNVSETNNSVKEQNISPRFQNDLITEINADEVVAALDIAAGHVIDMLPEFTEKFQNALSINGFYPQADNTDWTNGFWTGELWLSFEHTCDERLKTAALVQVKSFYDRIVKKISVDHHDMGFLYSLSCVAAYKLTGDALAKEAAILAAEQLIARFQPVGGFIQAWGSMQNPADYRLIIDCLMNLPLLFWASEETGDKKYKDIAEKHIYTALKNVIRKDFSTWHTFYFNSITGLPDHGATCQGYQDGSAWTRGQAWGIYGLAVAYKYTKEPEYIELFKGVTKYFLERLPDDMIPYGDLTFTDSTTEPRDSSSASIAACGMLEMAKYLDRDNAVYYTGIAKKLMKSLYDNYAVKDFTKSNGLVLHATYSNHTPYNTCHHCGVDECNIWGDYFYMEALTRLSKDWKLYW